MEGAPRPQLDTTDDRADDATDEVAAEVERGLRAWAVARADRTKARAERTFEAHRDRPLVDFGLRIYERDRDAAGSLVGSAVAFRLFLFFVPLLLFGVGILGFLSSSVAEGDIRNAGVTGTVARQIESALEQPSSTRWIATFVGLVGMASTGRTLSKVLTAASCLAWQLPVRAKVSVRAIGAIVGMTVGIALVSTLINRIRQEFGLGVAGVSFLAAVGIYVVLWVLLLVVLPRPTRDPGAVLPGAVVVAVTLAGLQAISQLYLPSQFDRASELYGAIGVTTVTLGWFFIMGRVIVLALAVSAVVYERFGSITELVFALPLLRVLPRRIPAVARFFGLDQRDDGGAVRDDGGADRDEDGAG